MKILKILQPVGQYFLFGIDVGDIINYEFPITTIHNKSVNSILIIK